MNGVELIAQERQRQIDVEGYDAEHDKHHSVQVLTEAAKAYTDAALNRSRYAGPTLELILSQLATREWPFIDKSTFKSKGIKADLIRAGALIAAALDRLEQD